MSKAIFKLEEKTDARIRIEKMLSGEDILLSNEEEKILARWQYANELMEAKQHSHGEVRQMIMDKHHVSRFTAENDIGTAMEVFGRAKRISKRYLLHLHLDRMDRDLERYRKAIFEYQDDEGNRKPCTPSVKEMATLAKLQEAYTKALDSIPEENSKSILPPPVLIFNLPKGVDLPQKLSFEDAMRMADEFIDYIEISKDGTEDRPTDQGDHHAAAPHDDPADPGQ